MLVLGMAGCTAVMAIQVTHQHTKVTSLNTGNRNGGTEWNFPFDVILVYMHALPKLAIAGLCNSRT